MRNLLGPTKTATTDLAGCGTYAKSAGWLVIRLNTSLLLVKAATLRGKSHDANLLCHLKQIVLILIQHNGSECECSVSHMCDCSPRLN